MLINCVVYENGRKLADIEVDDIGAWLPRPGCFVWVALRDATDEELQRMQRNFYGFDPSYHVARHHFVHKSLASWTPRHLARHRELQAPQP